MLRFVDAAHGTDANALNDARAALVDTLGEACMLDAAGVIGNFTMMTRIADSTGTPLDKGSIEMSNDIRQQMDVNGFATARFAT